MTLWGAPRTKKNSQSIRCNTRTGRRFISPSEAYRAYETDCLRQIPGKARQQIDLPVNVRCVYYMPTRRRVDLTNLLEATDDLLVRISEIEAEPLGEPLARRRFAAAGDEGYSKYTLVAIVQHRVYDVRQGLPLAR